MLLKLKRKVSNIDQRIQTKTFTRNFACSKIHDIYFKFSIEIVTFLSVSKEPDLVYKLLGESSLRFTLNCETGLKTQKVNVSLNRDICFIQL